MRFLRAPELFLFALTLGLAPGWSGAESDTDFRTVDLSGEWYVLVHFKDSRSENKEITKFKDFAWSIEQKEKRLSWDYYPYLMFDEGTELLRRHAMTEHLPWEPDEALWKAIRAAIEVSSRGMTTKRMSGSVEKGFSSGSGSGMGANVLTFSINWDVTFESDKIRIVVVDSLSGSNGLEGMEEATVFEIQERVAPDELRGSWKTGPKQGTFRMVRSRERRLRN